MLCYTLRNCKCPQIPGFKSENLTTTTYGVNPLTDYHVDGKDFVHPGLLHSFRIQTVYESLNRDRGFQFKCYCIIPLTSISIAKL